MVAVRMRSGIGPHQRAARHRARAKGGIERGERNQALESMFRLARALGTPLSALMVGVYE